MQKVLLVNGDERGSFVDKNRNIRMFGGEITAFLSMILLLLLGLVGTTLESARVNIGKSYADRSLQNAMDSLFTEYCIPIWEDYHIFLLEGEETEEQDVNYIRDTLYDYIEHTFSVDEMGGSTDLLDMNIQQLQIMDIVRAEDYNRELLLHEILEYSKYQVSESFFSDGEQVMEALDEVDACMTVMEKQMEAEQKMAEVNLEVLKFLSAVEGISVGATGIISKRNGLLKTETYFVKKFCPVAVTKENVGINHDIVWKSLQNTYCNPVSLLEQLEQEAESILVLTELAVAQAEAGEEVITVNYGGLYRLRAKLVREAKGVLKEIKNARKVLQVIKAKQSVFEKEAKELEEVYRAEEPRLSEESKTAFLKELESLKNFAGLESREETSVIAAILKMEDYLEENQKLVEQLLNTGVIFVGNNTASIEKYIGTLQQMKIKMRHYQVKELEFDYSSLIVEKEVENPVEAFSKVYKDNLLELVIKEPNSISRKAKKTQKRQMGEEEITKFQVEQQLQQLLLVNYIGEHFKCYTDEQKEGEEEPGGENGGVVNGENEQERLEKETVLDYEQEYLLSGKFSDRHNLAETVNKMVFTRSIINYIYLLTDKEKSDMAYGTAAALVGYSGMEPLVRLTKNIILFVWAAEEAIVDVSGLLQGKEMLIFKTKETFQITYEELLQFSRKLIQRKSGEMPDVTGEIAMNYEQYLQLLLILSSKERKLAGLAELIEDNIKIRYDNEFLLNNCIYGITVEGSFQMNEKFVSLPFVQQMLSTSGKGFLIDSRQSYCY